MGDKVHTSYGWKEASEIARMRSFCKVSSGWLLNTAASLLTMMVSSQQGMFFQRLEMRGILNSCWLDPNT